VIPVVLTVPAGRRRRTGGTRRLSWWTGAAVLVLGMAGTVVWVLGFSPVSFERFSAGAGAHSMHLDGPASYIVYEERSGNTPPALPVIVVQDAAGQRLVADLPDGRAARPVARSLPFFSAWELGRFDVPAGGSYSVYAVRPTPTDPRPAGILAVASDRSATWLGGWAGLVVLGFVPMAAGAVGMGLSAGRARRSGTGTTRTFR
jgi:hypothetical protein